MNEESEISNDNLHGLEVSYLDIRTSKKKVQKTNCLEFPMES